MDAPLRQPLALVSTPASSDPGPRAYLEKKIHDLQHAAHRIRHGGDGKAVHDARVATRRLAAILDVWQGELARKPRRRAERELKRLRRRLGAAREREVCLEQIDRALGDAVGEDAAALDALATRLRRRLPGDREKVERAAHHSLVERMVSHLRRTVSDDTPERGSGTPPLEEVQARVAKRREAALAALDQALAEPRDEILHQARIRAKKWRYGEETLAEARGVRTPKVVSVLRALQESLGANQDRAVWMARLERAARREAKRENAGRAQALRSRAAALRAEGARHRTEWASFADRLRAAPPAPSPPSD